jgi:deoxyribodipyrimidine photo-lyase
VVHTLYWHTDDLRIDDNPALALAAKGTQLACVYVWDDRFQQTDRFGNQRLGEHREKAVASALRDLDTSYKHLNQRLQKIDGVAGLAAVITESEIERVVRTRQHASDEVADWLALQRLFPSVEFEEVDGTTLYCGHQIEFGDDFPGSFSKFKRKMEKKDYREAIAAPESLPELISVTSRSYEDLAAVCGESSVGGESAGLAKLKNYFDSKAASTYKETRNQFMGENYSTRFSPWLALGCVSPVRIIERLRTYEGIYGANDSTGWIEFELLWREFFRWYGEHFGRDLFLLNGIHGHPTSDVFDQASFSDWSRGQTKWPIVNACMKELNATGFLSNRGRQIVASCLVNELGLDWRAGAGYFEDKLIDYDACSNWGNWQYIAGVGADPRGGRHFNLHKQAETWDADGAYRAKWLG